ncbi:MAG: thioredoxin [Promethearchaeia archaeon]
MEVSDKTFNEEIIEAQKPVFIEFWASWCIPCKMMEIVLKDLQSEFDGKIKIAKLNIDRNKRIPGEYNLTGVPTFMTFKNGEIIETKIGAQPKDELVKMIENVIT